MRGRLFSRERLILNVSNSVGNVFTLLCTTTQTNEALNRSLRILWLISFNRVAHGGRGRDLLWNKDPIEGSGFLPKEL